MPAELSTPRLRLVALSSTQLRLCLHNRHELENELGITIAGDLIDANVTRAINMKLAKMAVPDARFMEWITYWLIIIKDESTGAGLIGFKGYPDDKSKTEIGYGIDGAYMNKGYMTEAVQALCGWAFRDPECITLTAKGVVNPASARVLQKSGWHRVRSGDGSSDWEKSREGMHPGGDREMDSQKYSNEVVVE